MGYTNGLTRELKIIVLKGRYSWSTDKQSNEIREKIQEESEKFNQEKESIKKKKAKTEILELKNTMTELKISV